MPLKKGKSNKAVKKLEKLSKQEVFDAFRQGVKDAVLEMTDSGDGFSGLIRTEEFMNAIKDGVREAVWNVATNATSMPCTDFYEMIKQGVTEGIERCH